MNKKIAFSLLYTFILSSFIIPQGKVYIEVYKSTRKLYLMKDKKIVADFNMVLGFSPIGDKFREGDGKTPEGVFKIKAKYPHASWSKFIWFDYPNKESYNKFKERKIKKQLPNDASIGGDIGIHGVPNGMDAAIDQKNDWTMGCISVKNRHIDSIYKMVNVGTVLYINP